MSEEPRVKRTRRKRTKTKFHAPNGQEIESCYCRKCMKDLSPRLFYKASDELLDSNGLMSVCKSCTKEIFLSFYKMNHSISSAIYLTCKVLNVAYIEESLESTNTWCENRINKGKDIDGAFGFYKGKASGLASVNPEYPTTFDSYMQNIEEEINLMEHGLSEEQEINVKKFWGEKYDVSQYDYLAREYSNFKRAHKIETHSEVTLLKIVCMKLLAIKEVMENKGSTGKLEKELQDTMKSLGISPNQANSSDKSNETFGQWIKDIEEKKPAEWYEDQDAFKDVDDMGVYGENFIKRPIENFFSGERNFNLIESLNSEEDGV